MNELYDIGKNTVRLFKWRVRELTKTLRSRIEMSVDSAGIYLVTNGEARENAPSVIISTRREEYSGSMLVFLPTGNYWIYRAPTDFETDLEAQKAFYSNPTSFELVVADRVASRRG